MAYRACLAEADHAARFYHASFALDPINVSRTLLEWRATLYEHGWDGTFAQPKAPARLRDLADVETLARARVPLDRGQRVRRATAALDELRTQIDAIELLDEFDELPPVWRALLDTIGFSVAAGVDASAAAAEGSDLRIVQETLARLVEVDAGTVVKKTRCAATGRFVVLRGASRDITAQAIAECVIAGEGDSRGARDGSRDMTAQAIAECVIAARGPDGESSGAEDALWADATNDRGTRRHHSRQRVRTRRTAARRFPALLAFPRSHAGVEARVVADVATRSVRICCCSS